MAKDKKYAATAIHAIDIITPTMTRSTGSCDFCYF